mgnify:CR=1 FL=1
MRKDKRETISNYKVLKNEENRRLKEWEQKFDIEQKKKEEELIQKFYGNQPKDQNLQDVDDNSITNNENSDNEKNN